MSHYEETTLEQRLTKTVFAVEATSTEQFFLWRENAHESPDRPKGYVPVFWQQVNPGYMETIGHIGKRPVCVCCQWVILDGQWVMFYDCTSQVADHAMVDKWLNKVFKRKWDNGTRYAQCDAMNFGHCLAAVREASGKD